MPTAQLIALDLVAAALVAVLWLGAGAAAAVRQVKVAPALCAGAILATALRFVPALALWSEGWWFAQEKVTVVLPLIGLAAVAAAVLAGPTLLRAVRRPAGAADAIARPPVVAPLLTAGYAGAAGLLLTYLFGYPVGWGAALITIALVGVAALVTWQVMAAARGTAWRVAGVAVLALAVTGAVIAVRPDSDVDHGGGTAVAYPSTGTPVSAFRGRAEDMAPGGQVRRHTLTARKGTVQLASGREVAAWTYNGQVPGPEITAEEGDLIEVTLRNQDIERGVSLHWHGYDVPAGEDGAPGVTQEAVLPGQEYVYRFAAAQAGTYWYHTHQVSDVSVRMGLYGTLVVRPRGTAPEGTDLTLPVHTFGDTRAIGLHDAPQDVPATPGQPVRLRLVNTDSVPHRFTLAGTPFRLAAVDGRDLNEPGEVAGKALVLAAGGRYDLVFTMPGDPVALLLGNDADRAVRLRPGGGTADVPAPDTSGWPELDLLSYGSAAPLPFNLDTAFDRRFTMVLNKRLAMVGRVPKYAQTINGRAHPSTPTQVVEENDLVLMTVVNRSQEIHPWHLHGHTVVVLSRDGKAPTGSPLRLDSFDVRPGEVWQVGFRANNPGLWMNHCHNLPHQEQGMAIHLGYAGVTADFSHSAHG